MKKIFSLMLAIVATLSAMATAYQKVTAVSDLADGDVVVLVYETGSNVSGAVTNSKYLATINGSISGTTITVSGAGELTLGVSGTAYTLSTASGSIIGAHGSSNELTFGKTTNTTWNLSFDSNGNAVFRNVGANAYYIQYNTSSPRFSAYKNTQAAIQLYKKVAGSNPVMTLSASVLTFDTKALAEGTATDQKTLTVTASDLKAENITVALKQGTVFSVSPATLASSGGTVTVSYTATAEGTYLDTVVITGTTQADQPIVRECAVSVTIDPTAPTGTTVTYNLLQNVSDLHEGDKVFFGTAAKDFVAGLYDYDVASSNIRGVAATYSADHHTVTANDLYAYTVSIDANGKYIFTGSDGNYLCDYNAAKNLSSTATLDNKAKWTVTITDDVATIKNVNATNYQMLFNKTAPNAMFCCYSGMDSNTAAVMLYSDNAPAYQEPELHPAIAVTFNNEAVGDTLDWGEVVYDDSFGTEAAPYSEAKSLRVAGTDLSGNISVSLQTGSAFTIYSTSLPATGGTLSVNFEVTTPGTYTDVLTISYDTIVKTVVLKAKAVREATEDPSTKPTLTSTSYRVYLNGYFENEQGLEEMDIFYVSASNLTKDLYCKWENTAGFSIPSYTGEEMTVTLGDFGDVPYGSSLDLGSEGFENLEVTVYVNAFNPGLYESQLHFYTYAADKVTIAAEWKIDLVVNITTAQTPDPNPDHNPNVTTGFENVSVTLGGKVLRDGQVLIIRDGKTYNANGQLIK